MHVPVGNDGWYLCERSDHPDYEYRDFIGSQTLALQWANQFRGDYFAWYTLRRLLGGAFPPRSDGEISREVAWRLTSGAWVARRPIVHRVAVRAVESIVETPAFPIEDRRSRPPQSTSAPGPDAPLFPSDIDPVAIAEAQKEAAALGVPFCEECLRAQLASR